MVSQDIFITESSEETQKIGEDFAKNIKNGDFVAFYGNLGSGKTTFIQGLARGLKIKRRIISPTFIIVRNYVLRKGNFYHLDLYRTHNVDDLLGLGVEEIINDDENVVVVEWAEKMGNLLPQKRIEVSLQNLDDNKRKIKISKYE